MGTELCAAAAVFAQRRELKPPPLTAESRGRAKTNAAEGGGRPVD